MATKIPDISDYMVFGNRIVHIPKFKLFMVAAIAALAISFYAYTQFILSKEDELRTLVLNHPIVIEATEPIENKVVRYIKSVNSKLDDNTAFKLADAVIIESNQRGIPLKLILGLITVESKFDQYAISNAGALGFWQVMPKWHYDKIATLDNRNIYDPVSNTKLGAQILNDCLSKHRSVPMALQCYNGNQRDPKRSYSRKVLATAELIDV